MLTVHSSQRDGKTGFRVLLKDAHRTLVSARWKDRIPGVAQGCSPYTRLSAMERQDSGCCSRMLTVHSSQRDGKTGFRVLLKDAHRTLVSARWQDRIPGVAQGCSPYTRLSAMARQ